MYSGDPVLTVHGALAVVLLGFAVVLTVIVCSSGVRARPRGFVLTGLLSVVWAISSGAEFILLRFSNDGTLTVLERGSGGPSGR